MRIHSWIPCYLLAIVSAIAFYGFLTVERGFAVDIQDEDRDGIDDTEEYRLAKSFLPVLWYWDHESCPDPGVIIYHVRPFVPGDTGGPLIITYSMLYYEDCGSHGHQEDIENFAVTIHPLYPPSSSPSGYGAYSMTTVAHWGAGWPCEEWDTETYSPYKADLGFTEGPQFFPFWEEVYISDDKHSTFLTDGDCDSGCLYFGDECDPQLVVNVDKPVECRDDNPEDLLVFPENCGQLFYMYNIGEADDHLLETFQDLNDIGGFAFPSGSLWSRSQTVMYYLSSPADGVTFDPQLDLNSVFPNPVRKGADLSVNFNLGQRSLVWASIFSAVSGERLTTPILLGEYCPGDSIRVRAWNGKDDLGNNLADGEYILRLSHDPYADGSDWHFSIDGDPAQKPNSPTNLQAQEVSGAVMLTWRDNATDEQKFVVERISETADGMFNCGYQTIAYVDSIHGTGDVVYIDNDVPWGQDLRYRVYAVSTGGYSGYSNVVSITPSEIPPLELTTDCINPGDPSHYHMLHWTFNYVNESSFENYIVEYRYLWQGMGLGEYQNWTDWDTLSTIDDMWLTYFEHDGVNTGGCYQYKVLADVNTGVTMDTDIISHDYDCDVPPPNSGCPMISTWNGEQFVSDNNILARSEFETGIQSDFYHIRGPMAPIMGKYLLEVSEDEQEHSTIDMLKLIAVDHADDVEVGVTQGGKIFGYDAKEIIYPIAVTDNNGEDHAEEVLNSGESAFTGNQGDTLSILFSESGGHPILMVRTVSYADREKALGPDILLSMNRQGQNEGPWLEAGTILPRKRGVTQYIDLLPFDRDGGSIALKLCWLGPQTVDLIALITEEDNMIQVEDYALEKAVYSTGESIENELAFDDGDFTELYPGERFMLVFSGPTADAAEKKDFILESRGYYTLHHEP